MNASAAEIRQLRLPLQQETPQRASDLAISVANAAGVATLATWPEAPGAVLALFGPAGC
ncbi:MAG TPA: chromosomal replication initiator DnaA, partial [Brevundimonas sp.]|nr:chromosomal replication initiator DnaA [Brevundimonas sp.]